MFGGNGEERVPITFAEFYSIDEDEWTDLPDMPEASSAVVAVSANSCQYITG